MIKLAKGWHVHAATCSCWPVAGAGAGYLLGTMLARKAFDRRLDAEVESLKTHYRAEAAASVAQQKPRLDELVGTASAVELTPEMLEAIKTRQRQEKVKKSVEQIEAMICMTRSCPAGLP